MQGSCCRFAFIVFKYIYIYIYIYIHIYCGLVVTTLARNARDPGSIPGGGKF